MQWVEQDWNRCNVDDEGMKMGLFGNLFGLMQGNRKVLIAHDALLVDVRSPEEFANGNIEGSINLPVERIFTGMRKITPNLDANIVVYCASGMRSSSARKTLLKMGYVNVVNGGGVNGLASRMQKRIVQARS